MFFFLPGQPRPRPSPLLTGQAGGGGGSRKTLSPEWRRGGERRGRPPSFKNVSGMFPVGVGSRGGSGPSPHPGSTCSAGWGWGAGREGAGGPQNRFKEEGAGPGPGPVGAGSGRGGLRPARPLPAQRPGGTHPGAVPRLPWRERKSPKGGPRGERAEGLAGERLGEGWPAPLSGVLVGVGRVQGALLHLCALRLARA